MCNSLCMLRSNTTMPDGKRLYVDDVQCFRLFSSSLVMMNSPAKCVSYMPGHILATVLGGKSV